MTEDCNVCGDSIEESLKEHIETAHWNETDRPLVEEYYPDHYERLEGDSSNGAKMTCGLCDAPVTPDERTEHVLEEHENEPEEVLAEYPQIFDTYFEDDTESENKPSDYDLDKQGKWYMLGVGGCGNNVIDAMLLRYRTLDNDKDPMASIWEFGLQGFELINTNPSELAETFYARDMTAEDPMDVAQDYWLQDDRELEGAGNREDVAESIAENFFEEFSLNAFGINEYDISQASAGMLVHSAVKGTGTGATPVIAKQLREDFDLEDTLFSTVVLPSAGTNFDRNVPDIEKKNGIIGISRIAKYVDAIIPVDNNELRSENVEVPIKDIDEYAAGEYKNQNRTLVSFLESFSMSALPVDENDEGPVVEGDEFDVPDSYLPALSLYPQSLAEEDRRAVVLGPALNSITVPDGRFTANELEALIVRTLNDGKLTTFDPSTAIGGSFLFSCSPELYDQVRDLARDQHVFDEIIEKEQFLDTKNTKLPISAKDYYVKAPNVDGVHLWATFYNPEMDALEQMRDFAEVQRQFDTQFGHRIDEYWEDIERLFDFLGRDNFIEQVT